MVWLFSQKVSGNPGLRQFFQLLNAGQQKMARSTSYKSIERDQKTTHKINARGEWSSLSYNTNVKSNFQGICLKHRKKTPSWRLVSQSIQQNTFKFGYILNRSMVTVIKKHNAKVFNRNETIERERYNCQNREWPKVVKTHQKQRFIMASRS